MNDFSFRSNKRFQHVLHHLLQISYRHKFRICKLNPFSSTINLKFRTEKAHVFVFFFTTHPNFNSFHAYRRTDVVIAHINIMYLHKLKLEHMRLRWLQCINDDIQDQELQYRFVLLYQTS